MIATSPVPARRRVTREILVGAVAEIEWGPCPCGCSRRLVAYVPFWLWLACARKRGVA